MSHIAEGELTAFADGAYAPDSEDAQQISAHLASCVNCRNRLAEAQALSGRASEILAQAAPRIEPHEMPRPRQRIPLAWAAMVLLALGIGWFGNELTRERSKEPTKVVAAAPVERTAPPAAPAVSRPVVEPPTPARSRANTRAAAQTIAVAEAQRAAGAAADMAARQAAPAAALSAAPELAPAAAPPPAIANAPGKYVPGLAIIEASERDEGSVVQQRLPDGVVITVSAQPQRALLQRASAERNQAASKMSEAPRPAIATEVRDGFTITVSGPLPLDSLQSLLKKVK